MQLTILGCHSATPRANAHPTAQILDINGELMLIDCGEGTCLLDTSDAADDLRVVDLGGHSIVETIHLQIV